MSLNEAALAACGGRRCNRLLAAQGGCVIYAIEDLAKPVTFLLPRGARGGGATTSTRRNNGSKIPNVDAAEPRKRATTLRVGIRYFGAERGWPAGEVETVLREDRQDPALETPACAAAEGGLS